MNNAATLDERMALRNASAFASAQAAYDAQAEPEDSDDINDRLAALDAAEELIARARAELCNLRPALTIVDKFIADAADCLITE